MLFLLFALPLVTACPDSIIWGSSSATTVLADTVHTSAEVAQAPFWPNALPQAAWIWESSEKTLGTYTFLQLFPLTPALLDRVDKVTVRVAADDYYSINFNGHYLAKAVGQSSGPPTAYDLTPYVMYAMPGAPVMNRLRVSVTNLGGFAGVMFQVEVTLKN